MELNSIMLLIRESPYRMISNNADINPLSHPCVSSIASSII